MRRGHSGNLAADLQLATAGRTDCPIVMASGLLEADRYAAKTLAGCLRQMSGAESPVVEASPMSPRSEIWPTQRRGPCPWMLAGVVVLAISSAAQGGVEVVKDGRAVSEIVIAPDALQAVKLAAQDLQKHLKQMSGAELPIVETPSPGVASRVYVGESRFTRELGFKPARFSTSGLEILAEKSYVILVGPDKQRDPCAYGQTGADSIYLGGSAILGKAVARPEGFPSPGLKRWQEFCGYKFTTQHLDDHLGQLNQSLQIHSNDDTGTWYAVAELLEQLGVRWYMPYEDGTVMPDRPTVTIAEQHLVKEAQFDRREWCFYNAMRSDREGIVWLKRLKAGNYNTIM